MAPVGEQRRAGVIEVRVGVVALPHLLDREIEDARDRGARGAAARDGGLTRRCFGAETRGERGLGNLELRGRRLGRRDACLETWPGPCESARERMVGVAAHPRRRSRPRRRRRRRRRARGPPGGPMQGRARQARSPPRSSAGAGRRGGRRNGRAPSSPARPSRRCRSRRARRRGTTRARRLGARSPRARATRTRRSPRGRGRLEPGAASAAAAAAANDHGGRDPRALEGEARLGQRPAHVREHGERLCEAERPSDEGRRHVGSEPPLDAGGGANRAVVGTNRGAPRGRAVDEDSVRKRHTAEPQFVHGLRVPCCDGRHARCST